MQLQEMTNHDISEILELTTVNLLSALFRHWAAFTGQPDVLREAVATDRIIKHLVKFDLSPSMYARVVDEIVKTLGQFYTELECQFGPVAYLAPSDCRIAVRVRGQSIYLEFDDEPHEKKHSSTGHPGYKGITGTF
jgi:hypothetical protein